MVPLRWFKAYFVGFAAGNAVRKDLYAVKLVVRKHGPLLSLGCSICYKLEYPKTPQEQLPPPPPLDQGTILTRALSSRHSALLLSNQSKWNHSSSKAGEPCPGAPGPTPAHSAPSAADMMRGWRLWCYTSRTCPLRMWIQGVVGPAGTTFTYALESLLCLTVRGPEEQN